MVMWVHAFAVCVYVYESHIEYSVVGSSNKKSHPGQGNGHLCV